MDSFATLGVCAACSCAAEYAGGDRECLFTHDVQTIVGIRKETMLGNIGSVIRIYASLTARVL